MSKTPYPQELARKFLTSFDDVKLKLVQVASIDGQEKNLYALRIEDGEIGRLHGFAATVDREAKEE